MWAGSEWHCHDRAHFVVCVATRMHHAPWVIPFLIVPFIPLRTHMLAVGVCRVSSPHCPVAVDPLCGAAIGVGVGQLTTVGVHRFVQTPPPQQLGGHNSFVLLQ